MSKIKGVVKKKKIPVIVIDNDNGDEDDGYNTDDTNAGISKMVKYEYNSSDDEDNDKKDDVSPQEDDEEGIKVEANSGKLPPVSPRGRFQQEKKKTTYYRPHTSEFTNKVVRNVRNTAGHFQGVGVLNLSYRGQKYHLMDGVASAVPVNEVSTMLDIFVIVLIL